MHPILVYESVFFSTRDDLERLQPLSQSLLDIIVKGANVLPLRPIHLVDMASAIYKDPKPEDKIRIYVEDLAADGPLKPDYEDSIDDGDLAEIFRRLQNTCIKWITVGIRDSAFLRYWKAQKTAHFTVVNIDFGGLEVADDDVLDSIVNHLRPRTAEKVYFEESSLHDVRNDKMLESLARDSFLNNLQVCRSDVRWEAAFPPPSFMLEEPGYPNYELWCGDCQPADGIDALIESFVRNGCANKKLESQLKKSTKVDVPMPINDFTAWLTDRDHRVMQCEMRFFENTMQWMRMVVRKWTIELDDIYNPYTTHVLQCRVENL